MNPAAIGTRIRRDMGRLLGTYGSLNRVDVTLYYEDLADDSAVDPEMEDTLPDREELSCEVPALVHFVSPESVVQRGWTEIAAGDAIADFAHDVDFDGKRNMTFEIYGKRYQLKNTGRELREAWDTLAGGHPTTRTLLLEPMR